MQISEFNKVLWQNLKTTSWPANTCLIYVQNLNVLHKKLAFCPLEKDLIWQQRLGAMCEGGEVRGAPAPYEPTPATLLISSVCLAQWALEFASLVAQTWVG